MRRPNGFVKDDSVMQPITRHQQPPALKIAWILAPLLPLAIAKKQRSKCILESPAQHIGSPTPDRGSRTKSVKLQITLQKAPELVGVADFLHVDFRNSSCAVSQ
jgi:hypothetical protein